MSNAASRPQLFQLMLTQDESSHMAKRRQNLCERRKANNYLNVGKCVAIENTSSRTITMIEKDSIINTSPALLFTWRGLHEIIQLCFAPVWLWIRGQKIKVLTAKSNGTWTAILNLVFTQNLKSTPSNLHMWVGHFHSWDDGRLWSQRTGAGFWRFAVHKAGLMDQQGPVCWSCLDLSLWKCWIVWKRNDPPTPEIVSCS